MEELNIEQQIEVIETQIAHLQGALQVWLALREKGATVTLPQEEQPAG